MLFSVTAALKQCAEKKAPADTEDTRKPGTKKQEIVLL